MSSLTRDLPAMRPHPWLPFAVVAIAWTLVAVPINLYLGLSDRDSTSSQLLGNSVLLLALLFSTVACAIAAKRRPAARKAWGLMSLSMFMAALGQVVFSMNAISGASVTPSPVLDTVAYLGYSVPVIAGLFAFPKPPARLISRFRSVLDVLVIGLGLLFISEATVLYRARETADLQTVAGWSGLAYAVADLAICAVVFTLGMRQRPENRLLWMCLGSGLVILSITDSIYVRLLADGQTNLGATPLVLGWMAAPVLLALATLIPNRTWSNRHRDFALTAQLLPYLPVLGATVVLASMALHTDPFLLVVGVLLLIMVTVRQIMIIYENVTLTRDLEAKVATRTADLATLGSIVMSSSDAIVGVSMDKSIMAWNPAAAQLYGLPASDVLGRAPNFLPPGGEEFLDTLLERAEHENELGAYELAWPQPDGTTVPAALRVSAIRDGDAVRGISIFGQDITRLKREAAALEEAREEALESSRLKSEFLATMSHEIRTPMNGVIGLSSLLIATDLNSIQRQYAESVRGAGEALMGVINDILDFSKLEAGKVVLDRADFEPAQLVEDMGALLAPAAFAKNLELVAFCKPEVPKFLVGDAGRIRQVLLNLVSNAVKFTAAGEVAVMVQHRPLPDGLVALRFTVTDTGIGVTEEERERLFDAFSQADASTTRRFGGTGLGLAISRSLVEIMGGEIGFDSTPGRGSSFWFEVPLPVGTPTLSEDSARTRPVRGLRVLVVDDNATNREILKAQLTSWHMRADLVEDAATALTRLRACAEQGQGYHLALLDMMMPVMDGLELARLITADPALADTKIVLLTSSSMLEPDVLRQAGIEGWLTKPVRSRELHEKLAQLVGQPAVNVPATDPAPDHAVAERPSLGEILVVEDNAVNRLVANGVLKGLGYRVRTVVNGVDALAELESTRYSAVLMDCHMPVMDGYTATREIRRREAGESHVPIIAMTAGALPEDEQRCLAAGMDAYVSKPLDVPLLQAVLGRWVASADPTPGPDARGEGAPDDDALIVPIDESRLASLRLLDTDGSGFLASVVDSFVDRSADQLAELRTAARLEQGDRLFAAAHDLKGAAGTVGATRVAALCAEIERASTSTGQPVGTRVLDELATELDRANDALAHFMFSMS